MCRTSHWKPSAALIMQRQTMGFVGMQPDGYHIGVSVAKKAKPETGQYCLPLLPVNEADLFWHLQLNPYF